MAAAAMAAAAMAAAAMATAAGGSLGRVCRPPDCYKQPPQATRDQRCCMQVEISKIVFKAGTSFKIFQ